MIVRWLKRLFSKPNEDSDRWICMWPEFEQQARERARANPQPQPEERSTETTTSTLPPSMLRFFESEEWAAIKHLTLEEQNEMIKKSAPRAKRGWFR